MTINFESFISGVASAALILMIVSIAYYWYWKFQYEKVKKEIEQLKRQLVDNLNQLEVEPCGLCNRIECGYDGKSCPCR